jgi:hypothetical protein
MAAALADARSLRRRQVAALGRSLLEFTSHLEGWYVQHNTPHCHTNRSIQHGMSAWLGWAATRTVTGRGQRLLLVAGRVAYCGGTLIAGQSSAYCLLRGHAYCGAELRLLLIAGARLLQGRAPLIAYCGGTLIAGQSSA